MDQTDTSAHLTRFAPILTAASEDAIRGDVTLGGQLVIERAGDLVVSYAPFEHIELSARIVIVGITPGAQQACNALLEVRRQLLAGNDHASALAAAKVFASFSGPMRTNLIAMFDHIGLHRFIGVQSAADLWNDSRTLVNFTSALRYPVFVAGKNYSGQPSMTAIPILRNLLDTCLHEEARALPKAAWIPLGPKASQGVDWLVQKGMLDRSRVFVGLPHPSGANAERIAYFLGRKSRATLSSKTNAATLDDARERLSKQVMSLVR
jgi:hypothetical protein